MGLHREWLLHESLLRENKSLLPSFKELLEADVSAVFRILRLTHRLSKVHVGVLMSGKLGAEQVFERLNRVDRLGLDP